MQEAMAAEIWRLVREHARESGLELIWEPPLVRCADARDPLFARLRDIVVPNHYLPQDYLPKARSVLSWFIPFKKAVAAGNGEGLHCSAAWAAAYLATNAMAAHINERLAAKIRARGGRAAVPHDAGMISRELIYSRWSQKHVAWIAGHGTFGRNNMLISDVGCVGRYYSLVTDQQARPDPLVREERCLYKKSAQCGLCVRQCPSGALSERGFDRRACLEMCERNDALYPGADVCGKCVVNLPCSFARHVRGAGHCVEDPVAGTAGRAAPN